MGMNGILRRNKMKAKEKTYNVEFSYTTEKEKAVKLAIAKLYISSPYINHKRKKELIRELKEVKLK
jgi:hypothetical protein